MRSEFQDVFKEAYDHWIDDACSHRYNASKGLALQVWQHQQSKIDELQKQRDSFIKAYEIDKSDELQKRVDAVNGLIEDLNKCYQQDHQNKFEYWRGFADSAGILGKRLERALKGDGK